MTRFVARHAALLFVAGFALSFAPMALAQTPNVDPLQLLGIGAQALKLAETGQWAGLLVIALAAIPFAVAWATKTYAMSKWMQSTWTHVIIQAAVSAGMAALSAVVSGQAIGSGTLKQAGTLFATSLIGWFLLHINPPVVLSSGIVGSTVTATPPPAGQS